MSTSSIDIATDSFVPATSSFSQDEIKALRCFMSSLNPSASSPQTSFAQLSTSASAFSANVSTPGHSWIIDSGASDHMTGTSTFFLHILFVLGRIRYVLSMSLILLLQARGIYLPPPLSLYLPFFMFPSLL